MPEAIEISELPSRFREVLERAEAGQEVVLVDGGTPRARIVPLQWTVPRQPGLHAGAMQSSEDFDAPLSDQFWADQP